MRKIIIGTVVVMAVLAMGFFGWRVFHFYRLIKSGNLPPSAGIHFNKSSSKAVGTGEARFKNLVRAGSPRLGNPAAKISIVEFADFSCEFSTEAYPVIRELLAKYPDKVNLAFRFFPMHNENADAQNAALAALCANEQGRFWAYHDKLFGNRGKFSRLDLESYALQVGIDMAKFTACLDSKKFESELNQDISDGAAMGVGGTPTFFVNGEKIEGAIPLKAWEKVFNLR